MLTTIKADKNYLIRTNMVLKINFLSLLDMIANYSIYDITILKWIAYIKIFNLIFVYIFRKKNIIKDMLFKTKYIYKEEIQTQKIDEDEDYNYILDINRKIKIINIIILKKSFMKIS